MPNPHGSAVSPGAPGHAGGLDPHPGRRGSPHPGKAPAHPPPGRSGGRGPGHPFCVSLATWRRGRTEGPSAGRWSACPRWSLLAARVESWIPDLTGVLAAADGGQREAGGGASLFLCSPRLREAALLSVESRLSGSPWSPGASAETRRLLRQNGPRPSGRTQHLGRFIKGSYLASVSVVVV